MARSKVRITSKRVFEKFGEVKNYVNRLTIIRIMARQIKVSKVCGKTSQSRTNRRHLINQPRVRSTTHRFFSRMEFLGIIILRKEQSGTLQFKETIQLLGMKHQLGITLSCSILSKLAASKANHSLNFCFQGKRISISLKLESVNARWKYEPLGLG